MAKLQWNGGKKNTPISILSESFVKLGSHRSPERLNGFPEKWRDSQIERERERQGSECIN